MHKNVKLMFLEIMMKIIFDNKKGLNSIEEYNDDDAIAIWYEIRPYLKDLMMKWNHCIWDG